jgi:hypothetical protein
MHVVMMNLWWLNIEYNFFFFLFHLLFYFSGKKLHILQTICKDVYLLIFPQWTIFFKKPQGHKHPPTPLDKSNITSLKS